MRDDSTTRHEESESQYYHGDSYAKYCTCKASWMKGGGRHLVGRLARLRVYCLVWTVRWRQLGVSRMYDLALDVYTYFG
jgi:hypothetical protein